MWKCPICGRSFAKRNQGHFCTQKPTTIDAYIAQQEEDKQADLNLVRQTLREALPDAEERISWSMPTYWKDRNILHFAASGKHIGFYPGSEAVLHFAKELEAYETQKGTIRIPYGKVDPVLLKKIARWCWETDHHA